MRLLDSDVMVDLRRQYALALAWFSGLTEEPMVPGFVVLELMEGCRNQREMRRLQQVIAPFRLVWPAAAECERALTTFAQGYLRHGLGVLDSLIGECAVGLGAVLC